MLHIEISAGFKLVKYFLKYNLTPSAKGTGLDAVELEFTNSYAMLHMEISAGL